MRWIYVVVLGMPEMQKGSFWYAGVKIYRILIIIFEPFLLFFRPINRGIAVPVFERRTRLFPRNYSGGVGVKDLETTIFGIKTTG